MEDLAGRIASLYEKDTSEAYKNLQALEALSDKEDTLYSHLGEFIAMLDSDRYVARVRGFRLLCKQAQWDSEGILDASIGRILAAVSDEKPTAVRQALKALEDVVPYKKGAAPCHPRGGTGAGLLPFQAHNAALDSQGHPAAGKAD